MPDRSPTVRWRSSSADGWTRRSASTPPTPRTYHASRRMIDGRWPRTGSSYSAAPKRSASTRSITSNRVRPMATSTRSSTGMASITSRLVGAQHGEECLLWDLHRAHALHPALALFLLLEQLPLPGDVPTVAFGQDVLAHRADGLAGDHVRADGRLDGHLEHLSRDQLAQSTDERAPE